MKSFKFCLFSLLLSGIWLSNQLHAQQVGSIDQAVIGSSGNYSTSGNFTLSSTTGECIVPTVTGGPFILTQGFQQPSSNGTLALNTTLVFYNATCLGAQNGTASVTAIGGTAPYYYTWSTGSNDSLSTNDSLAPGTYTVTITDAGNLSQTHTFVIVDGTEICGVTVYHGFTPNGDGHNDFWIIDYLDLHQPNTVTIFNRWGYEVWSKENYDNTSVVWDGKAENGDDLPDGTYYYVITMPEGDTKGWVELTH